MTPDERIELGRIVERLRCGNSGLRAIAMMDLRRFAGEPINELEYRRLITDVYHKNTHFGQRLAIQLERNRLKRKDGSPALDWFEGTL